MIKIENNLVTSDSGMIVCRKSNGACAKSHMALPGDTVDSFEELEAVPAYTKAEYDAKVAEMVAARYPASEEAALHRKMINAMRTAAKARTDEQQRAIDEYEVYDAFVEQCKADAPEAIMADKAAAEAAMQPAEDERQEELPEPAEPETPAE